MIHKDLFPVLSPECSVPLLENFDLSVQILLPQEEVLSSVSRPVLPFSLPSSSSKNPKTAPYSLVSVVFDNLYQKILNASLSG